MNIAVNARFLSQPVTGTQRFAINISREIKKKQPGTIFLAPPVIKDQALASELEVTIIGKRNYHRYAKLHLPASVLWEQIDLPRWLKKHGRLPLLNLVNLAPLLYSENFVTIHDLAFRLAPHYFAKRFRLYYNCLIPFISRRAKQIITVSHFSKQTIETYLQVPASKVLVAHNAVDLQGWPMSVEKKNKPYPWPYVLAVGSLEPRKNLNRLIAAFKRINDKHVHLVIVGRENPAIFHRTKQTWQEKILFTGPVDDDTLSRLYAHALCLCYPSFHEGFGLPPLEAQAFGCPVIVSNQTSLPEVFLNSALYCDPHDVESIRKNLHEMLTDTTLRQQLVTAGYNNIKRFSWEKSASTILEAMK